MLYTHQLQNKQPRHLFTAINNTKFSYKFTPTYLEHLTYCCVSQKNGGGQPGSLLNYIQRDNKYVRVGYVQVPLLFPLNSNLALEMVLVTTLHHSVTSLVYIDKSKCIGAKCRSSKVKRNLFHLTLSPHLSAHK